MEIHKVENTEGKLLRLLFNRTVPEEDMRVLINTWIKKNYPKMTLREFFSRLDGLSANLWIITMEDKVKHGPS